jgi:hypothetical protein
MQKIRGNWGCNCKDKTAPPRQDVLYIIKTYLIISCRINSGKNLCGRTKKHDNPVFFVPDMSVFLLLNA